MQSAKLAGILLVGITISLFVSACGDNNQTTTTPENIISAETRLVPAASDNQLEQYLKHGFTRAYSYSNDSDLPQNIETAPNDSTSLAADRTGNSSTVSSTNLQVSGADEADRIKNDNNTLYSINQPEPYYYAEPAVATAAINTRDAESGYQPPSPLISVHQIQADPAASQAVTEIDLQEPGAWLTGLYLTTDSAGHGRQLIGVGYAGQMRNGWSNPWNWQAGRTKLWFFDVAEPGAPQQTHNISIDGYLINSRRVEDKLYLVTRFTPHIEDFVSYPTNEEERADNQRLLDSTSLDELLPKASLNDATAKPLVLSDNCFLPDTTDTDRGFPTLTTITAIDLNAPEQTVSVCYGGHAYGLFASTKNIYLAAVTYHEISTGDVAIPLFNSNSSATTIHKFAMSNDGPSYQGSGVVPGTLSSNGGSPSFLMGESGDVLHVITSWINDNFEWQHTLSNLKSNSSSTELEVIAQLPNEAHPEPIGKPGEMIYASRYIGNRAYIVTFQKVDPLYVIDLSDETDPVIAGELEMPGFSSYLHAINDDLLLGIGKDAVPDNSGNFAWFQGLKLSLFNVADISAPTELSSMVIGERGTHSPVLDDHHALAYLPGGDGTPHKFTIPVSLHQGGDQTEPWQRANWQHDGLYLFEINDGVTTTNADLSHSGTLIAEELGDSLDSWGRWTYADRAVIQGSAVHYLHDNELISADWDAVTP